MTLLIVIGRTLRIITDFIDHNIASIITGYDFIDHNIASIITGRIL